jgi:pSer/pThr/pTyr-binding forkhead associated (FHA) protein
LIRAVEEGYEIIDLNSKNGTWLDGKRLVPNQPNALPSGARLLLGQMDFIVMYQSSPDVEKQT